METFEPNDPQHDESRDNPWKSTYEREPEVWTKDQPFLRVLSSVFIVVAVVVGILIGGWFWAAVASAAALLSLVEFYNLLSTRYPVNRWIGMGAAVILLCAATLELSLTTILAVISIISFLILFMEVLRRQVTGGSHALRHMGTSLAGISYIVLPWVFLIIMRAREWGHLFLLTLFACTWACDVAAYLVGSRWGKTPLCDKVSPRKTWEGFGGGAVASLLCAGFLAFVFEFPPLPLLLLGLLCGLAGQLGDLGESVLKREAGVKDSGHLIPGHGGFLDRFDSLLVNATLAFLIFEVIGR